MAARDAGDTGPDTDALSAQVAESVDSNARLYVNNKSGAVQSGDRAGMSGSAEVRKLRQEAYFLPYQAAWINDKSRLRIVQKGRQLGFSYCDSYDSVKKAAIKGGLDVWVMSRDEGQAKQYILYCKKWAQLLKHVFQDVGEQIFTDRDGKAVKIQVLTFASGASIYALSSNPDAIVGKTGHVKLDEFAIHKDQRTLYAVAKPVTQWGGTLSIISTHRGAATVFYDIVRDITERGNKMGWSLHTVPVQKAVEDGLVERINKVTGGHETREEWLARVHAECIDEEQWLQEYCCIPADESSAFISYEMINQCTEAGLVLSDLFAALSEIRNPKSEISNPYYLGVDVARKTDLCVLDLGEKMGDVIWDRARIELKGKRFAEIRETLYQLLALPELKRCCIDSTGLGMQLAEEAREKFGWKVEPVTFTGPVKEELAFGLRQDFEDRKLRLPHDDKLRADLRGIKKEVTAAGNIRFAGESADSHCDRFWAKALRQHAARVKGSVFSSALI